MKYIFFLLFAAFSLGAGAQSTENPEYIGKWNNGVGLFLNGKAKTGAAGVKSVSTNPVQNKLGVIIECTDAAIVAEAIKTAGCEATEITETIVTAELDEAAIRAISTLDEVLYISASRKHRPTISDARSIAQVDKIHSGSQLETPFTGKGVILGVIDQGFEYKHRAFLDENGNSRLRALWIRNSSSGVQALPIEDPTKIPDYGDGLDTGGHGTHVANIAAGSKWEGHELYGVAPEAELIIIPSSFDDDKVIEEVRYIKKFAEAEGKPWVVNMSFGSHIGPHDGTTLADQTITGFCKDGGLIVAAMGNEGDEKIHVQHTFAEKGTTTILLSRSQTTQHEVDIWEQTGDGKTHLTLRPFLYNKTTGKRDYKTSAFWRSTLSQTTQIDKYNKKENHTLVCYTSSLGLNNLFGVEISADAGASFHAWSNGAVCGEFVNEGNADILSGNSEYTIGEGSAAIPAAIAVGAYTSATKWQAYHGGAFYNYEDPSLTTRGDICYFSSYGPSLNTELPKPTILAPGSAVKSAVSQYSPGFSTVSSEIVDVVRSSTKNYYYAVMAGTSMASPFVAGVMALWLEAYPELNYTQAIDILQNTALKDRYTGRFDDWDVRAGYGKIQAYDGLKEVLQLAATDGINEVLNDERPITLCKGNDAWRILFNTNESFARIALHDLSGRLIKQEYADSPRRGEEITISLSDLSAGTYLINVSTTKNCVTRKVVVK